MHDEQRVQRGAIRTRHTRPGTRSVGRVFGDGLDSQVSQVDKNENETREKKRLIRDENSARRCIVTAQTAGMEPTI